MVAQLYLVGQTFFVMNDINQKIKNLRKEVIKTFWLFFVPHLIVCALTTAIFKDQGSSIKWQIGWFGIYFTIALAVYILAPKIIKRKK